VATPKSNLGRMGSTHLEWDIYAECWFKSILPQTIGDFERVFFEWACASNFELVNLLQRYQICYT
jgi:hypothetical protein